MFFLAGDQIGKLTRSNNSLGKNKKGNYEYLLAKRLSRMKRRRRFRRFFRRRRFNAPMVMARGVRRFRARPARAPGPPPSPEADSGLNFKRKVKMKISRLIR
jgi:hypothetical protein